MLYTVRSSPLSVSLVFERKEIIPREVERKSGRRRKNGKSGSHTHHVIENGAMRETVGKIESSINRTLAKRWMKGRERREWEERRMMHDSRCPMMFQREREGGRLQRGREGERGSRSPKWRDVHGLEWRVTLIIERRNNREREREWERKWKRMERGREHSKSGVSDSRRGFLKERKRERFSQSERKTENGKRKKERVSLAKSRESSIPSLHLSLSIENAIKWKGLECFLFLSLPLFSIILSSSVSFLSFNSLFPSLVVMRTRKWKESWKEGLLAKGGRSVTKETGSEWNVRNLKHSTIFSLSLSLSLSLESAVSLSLSLSLESAV